MYKEFIDFVKSVFKTQNHVPLHEPRFWGNEKKYLMECIETGWISSEGPFISSFEEKFASYCQRKNGIAVCNGSAALDVAVAALELPKGCEVILPSFTIISCAAAIIRNGCIPVPIDCHPNTWTMRIEQIESSITKNTKAIMAVHIYGLPVDMNPILDLARKYNLYVIEDAAQMHGQTYYGKPCGSFGDISTFSFYPNKHITTGEGGMILTDNEKLARRCKSLRNLCFVQNKRFVHDELGWNYRMTNMQAALGLAQLEQLDRFTQIKRTMGDLYMSLLKTNENLKFQVQETPYSKNNYWVFGIVLSDHLPHDASYITNLLNQKGIGSRPFFWPMHEQPVFKKMGLFKNVNLPVSERIARRGFYLPSGMALKEKQLTHCAKTLLEIIDSVRK